MSRPPVLTLEDFAARVTTIILVPSSTDVYYCLEGNAWTAFCNDNPSELADLPNFETDGFEVNSVAILYMAFYVKDHEGVWRLDGALDERLLPLFKEYTKEMIDCEGSQIVLGTTRTFAKMKDSVVVEEVHQRKAVLKEELDPTKATFETPMVVAEANNFDDQPDEQALHGEFSRHPKASIRFGIAGLDVLGSKAQRNIMYQGAPATRKKLAEVIATEFRSRLNGKHVIFAGKAVFFEDFYLVDVERVTKGTLHVKVGVKA